ncbi:MAG: SpoIIE family protein phosphatase, partial [Vicinamibacterales bacterium]
AENVHGDMFGPERLQAILAEQRTHGVDTILERVEEAVRRFRGKIEPHDDATLMALRVSETPGSGT